ncbi:MAG: hypothetical protein MUF70_01805 [Myxococcota bacterium]|jgi:uncharacterized protein involved in exopolysaccharide biosynthesis|nr:hypothetical protein [Myxococcota bacterium]
MADFDEEGPQAGLPDWLRDPVAVLRRRWQAMLVALLVGFAVTAVATALRKPVYLAQASVLLATQKVTEDLVKPTTQASPLEGIDAFAAEALSSANLKRVIDEFGLFPEEREARSSEEVAAMMRENISIEAVEANARPQGPMRFEKSKVLSIGYESYSATQAAAVATRLAQIFQAEGLRMRSEQARLATEFMRREVKSAEEALRVQKAAIAEFEEQHRGELPSDLEMSQRRIERLQDQRNSLATALAEAETRFATSTGPADAASPGARLAAAKAQLASQRAVNTDTHPNVISLKRQIADLEREVRTSGGGGGGGGGYGVGRRELANYREQIAAADAEMEQLELRMARMPQREVELAGLQQRAKVVEESYFQLLAKLKEAELAESLELSQQGGVVAVLQEATPPLTPEKGRLKIAAAGVFASLGLAFALAMLLELRDPVIATAQGVEALAGVPVLGVMPKVS